MKIALVSDIHANLPALEAVASDIETWQPDVVAVAGDIINRGPSPVETLRLVEAKARDAGWIITRGNHEEYVIGNARPDAVRSGPQFEIYRSSFWTYQQLGEAVDNLCALPFQASITGPDGREVRFTHASMRAINDGIYQADSDDDVRAKIGTPPPAVLCVGHTHRPLIRQVDGVLVINAGAVGAPFDRDPRLSYARLTWQRGQWDAEIVRLDYDRGRADRDFETSGYLESGGPIVALMRQEWRVARPLYPYWYHDYHDRVLAGDIPLADSVHEYLNR